MTIRDLIRVLDKNECRPRFYLMRDGVEFKTIGLNSVKDYITSPIVPYLDYEVVNIFPNDTYDLWIHAKAI